MSARPSWPRSVATARELQERLRARVVQEDFAGPVRHAGAVDADHRGQPQGGPWSPLLDHGEVVGAVLRTRTEARPVFVSVGHQVSLATAIGLVLRCAPRFRLPDPLRLADRLAWPPGWAPGPLTMRRRAAAREDA